MKNSPAFIGAIAALLCGYTGCTSINAWGTAVPMGDVRYPAVPTEHVMILFATPTREHIQIGVVSSLGGMFTSEGEMFQKMQRKAAELGADAIIVRSADATEIKTIGGTTVVQTQSNKSGFEYPKTNAIAIKYK